MCEIKAVSTDKGVVTMEDIQEVTLLISANKTVYETDVKHTHNFCDMSFIYFQPKFLYLFTFLVGNYTFLMNYY